MQWFDIHLTDSRWEKSEKDATKLRIKGPVCWNGVTCTTETLIHEISEVQTTEELIVSLNHLNGFYAWIEETSGRIRAAVDHIRSRPLFYSNFGGCFFLSDNAEWVRKRVGDCEMDPIAREEFQLAGYVTGAETLFPNVKQLQAGEFLVATQQNDGITVETHRYYRFLHTEPEQVDEPALRERLDEVAVASIQRLVDYASGRQIVVPLSGGYDSRLIVTLLKQLGYDNILTFTYGVPGNKESAYSKRVADALGLRWHFVEYSEALWREAWQTPERWEYQKWASGWSCIAHVQDWLAVKIMKEEGVVESDCLFVPGHSGDFIAGSHIPANAFQGSFFNMQHATDAVISRHYALAPLKCFETGRETWSKRIRDRMERDDIETAWHYADVFEKWEWQERQAKFIGNSVRVYEFFGYDWWMPLWDKEFVEFWQTIPLELRRDTNWYTKYVAQSVEIIAVDPSAQCLPNAADPSQPGKLLRSVLRRLGLLSYVEVMVKAGKGIVFARGEGFSSRVHFLLCGFNSEVVKELGDRGYSTIGIYAYANLMEFEQAQGILPKVPSAH